MGNLEDYPLGAGMILRSMVSGLGMVWGPLAAVLLGIFLGLLTDGILVSDPRWLLAIVVGFPVTVWTSIPTFVIGVVMLGTWMQFLVSEEWRVEGLHILCGLAQLETFFIGCAELELTWGAWDVLRAAGVFLVIPAAYVGLRLLARRRLRAFERQIEEVRQARLRGE